MIHQITLSDSFSPIMFHINSFHDLVMVVVLAIISLVGFIFFSIVYFNNISREMNTSETLEIFWTILPIMVLAFLAAPSLFVLYLSEELPNPQITVNVIGHQWYWSYEYDDELNSHHFDSYMVPTSELWSSGFRLLEVDNRALIPVKQEVRIIITSSDVIHSWAVPSLGVKADAIPGRLNQLCVFSTRLGVLYGQCSEICGANHAFIPICVEILPSREFLRSVIWTN